MSESHRSIYLVTGASRGIGAALAQALDARGASLFLVARSEIDGTFSDAETFRADLARRADIDAMLDAFVRFVAARDARTVTVVNNAGLLAPIAPAHRADADAMADAIAVNLLAPMLITAAFIRRFEGLSAAKRVVNISSGAASSAYAGWSTYCAGKAGLDHFTRCVGLEQERESHPTMVIAIAPGVVDTDMQAEIRASTEDDFPMLQKFAAAKASGSLPGADETAGRLLQFLDNWPLEHGGIYDVRHAGG